MHKAFLDCCEDDHLASYIYMLIVYKYLAYIVLEIFKR